MKKIGTPEEQCRKAFREMCAGTGSHKCGDYMMRRRMWME